MSTERKLAALLDLANRFADRARKLREQSRKLSHQAPLMASLIADEVDRLEGQAGKFRSERSKLIDKAFEEAGK